MERRRNKTYSKNIINLNKMQQYSGLLMIVALFAIMYFFMIRPQQKKQ